VEHSLFAAADGITMGEFTANPYKCARRKPCGPDVPKIT
jgi:hypothetical protein